MPCYATGSAEGDAQLAAAEVREELARVTRVACELAEFARDFKRAFSKETTEWMADHARLDRARKLREQAREEERRIKNSALKKLSTKERKLLGV